MGGPAASILLPKPLHDEQLRSLRRLIEQRSNHIEGDDFWIHERPFSWTLELDYEGQLEEFIEMGLSQMLGWQVEAMVTFGASCNGIEDHRILGELCSSVARLLGGMIDFGGQLVIEGMPYRGTLYGCRMMGNLGPWTWHVGDVEFLDWWLQQKNFRMVK